MPDKDVTKAAVNIAPLGGHARAKSLSSEERREIAQMAAAKRWGIPKASHTGKLAIGDVEFECAVLDDGTRVLSQRSFMKGMGLAWSGSASRRRQTDPAAADLPTFINQSTLKPFIDNDLRVLLSTPIRYLPVGGVMAGSRPAFGLKAELIPKICTVWLMARDAGALSKRQLEIAGRADILIRALAQIGIVALVDEATGYQDERDAAALRALLDRYLAQELAAWAKRFPDEFYRHIFRLRGWTWKGMRVNRPSAVANYTRTLVYNRLAPGLLKELEQRNPMEDGRRKSKHHQWLSGDVGHPALAQHLHAVIALMRASSNWEDFMAMMDRALPKRGERWLPFPIDQGL